MKPRHLLIVAGIRITFQRPMDRFDRRDFANLLLFFCCCLLVIRTDLFRGSECEQLQFSPDDARIITAATHFCQSVAMGGSRAARPRPPCRCRQHGLSSLRRAQPPSGNPLDTSLRGPVAGAIDPGAMDCLSFTGDIEKDRQSDRQKESKKERKKKERVCTHALFVYLLVRSSSVLSFSWCYLSCRLSGRRHNDQ